MRVGSEASTSVYLYFDRYDVLIYVGVTSRGIARQREHNADKDWWPYVTRQEVEHLNSRKEALNRERELIALMAPPFNTVHNPDPRTREAYLALHAAGGGGEPADKWIPMRVGYHRGDFLILATPMEYATVAATLSTDASRFNVSSNGRLKIRDVELSHVGSALLVSMSIKSAPTIEGARMKYRHVQGGRQHEREAKHLFITFECWERTRGWPVGAHPVN